MGSAVAVSAVAAEAGAGGAGLKLVCPLRDRLCNFHGGALLEGTRSDCSGRHLLRMSTVIGAMQQQYQDPNPTSF